MPETREPSTLDLRALAFATALVGGGIALAVIVPWGILAGVDTPAHAPNNAEPPKIAGPVQQTAPRLEREAFEREKRKAAR